MSLFALRGMGHVNTPAWVRNRGSRCLGGGHLHKLGEARTCLSVALTIRATARDLEVLQTALLTGWCLTPDVPSEGDDWQLPPESHMTRMWHKLGKVGNYHSLKCVFCSVPIFCIILSLKAKCCNSHVFMQQLCWVLCSFFHRLWISLF